MAGVLRGATEPAAAREEVRALTGQFPPYPG